MSSMTYRQKIAKLANSL